MALQELFPTPAGPVAGNVSGGAAWPTLLIVTALLSSFTFACVTPFAAFAVLTAATLSLPRAVAMTVAIWLVNQALGFLALGYPLDAPTFAWGAAIGVAALGATVVAAAIVRAALAWPLWSRLVAAFVAALAVYEAVLFLVSLALGGSENFSPTILSQLALSDACWLVGIAILRHGLLRFEVIGRPGQRPMTT